ncbi:hypothetical protein PSTT_02968 [Puccinia striiformis]|uniref:Uncharacterized protein n=1 Tax=Puccinia striiformis TaxID=27350 RepID=A0A2S4VY77_9BASI|nr:hypothetical protein PSTT_02968 [Puccinia striiformis]
MSVDRWVKIYNASRKRKTSTQCSRLDVLLTFHTLHQNTLQRTMKLLTYPRTTSILSYKMTTQKEVLCLPTPRTGFIS